MFPAIKSAHLVTHTHMQLEAPISVHRDRSVPVIMLNPRHCSFLNVGNPSTSINYMILQCGEGHHFSTFEVRTLYVVVLTFSMLNLDPLLSSLYSFATCILYSKIQHNTVQYTTVQYITLLRASILLLLSISSTQQGLLSLPSLCSTLQYTTVQYSTI